MSYTRRAEYGDTIVEMIFAFAILSLVVVGTMIIMNRGIRMSQESIERTIVRQQMDGQAEMIRFIHDTNPQVWNEVKAKVTDRIMPLSQTPCPSVSELSVSTYNAFFVSKSAGNTFAINPITGSTYTDPPSYAKIDYTTPKAYGMWLQLAKAQNESSTAASLTAYDVYIHGCWYGAGADTPTTLGTIVRLYDQS